MVKKKSPTLEELEDLVIYGDCVATRRLALVDLKKKYYSIEPAKQLQAIQKILNK